MAVKLTPGAIEDMFSKNPTIEYPVLQVLDFKSIQTGGHERYRLMISDGNHKTPSTMLATQLNEIVGNELTPFSVFRVDRYVCNLISVARKVIIFLDLTVLTAGESIGRMIDSPQLFEVKVSEASSTNQRESHNTNQTASYASATPKASTVPAGVLPIASLTPYQNKWMVRVRVTNKSAIRTWSNSRGQGKLFSMDLLDESGEIKATAFNEQCDKFYNMIDINKVFYLSQAQLKTANKQFSSLKNDYEITFHSGTQVVPCEESTDIPTMQFEFVSIDQLDKIEKDMTVDVIGICKEDSPITTVTQKSTGKELKKKDLQIVDESGTEVRLTIWGAHAEQFDGSLNPIIAAKHVKVSDFNGKSLSLLSSSSMQVNPDIKEAHRLRAWYENTGNQMQTVNLSNQKTAGGGFGSNIKTIGEAGMENLGCGDQADYYTTKATVSLIRKENCLYPACPSEGCNKKVIDQSNGVYRCEKCNREYDTFNWRLLLSVSLADGTDNVWVTIFQEQAELLLGCTAADLGMKKEMDDETAFQSVFNNATFKEYILKLRVKMETYNDEKRLKTTVVSVQPLDCVDYNKKLIQQIKSMAGLTSN